MSRLAIFDETAPEAPRFESTDPAAIGRELNAIGVRYEHHALPEDVTADRDQDYILDRLSDLVAAQRDIHGYQTADVARVPAGLPDPAPIRAKFLNEHIHAEDEARLMLDGAGSFYLHVEGKVFQVTCERGDLISVPAGVKHWFDMGEKPCFSALRFFTDPNGWVADFTGDDIAARFPEHVNAQAAAA
ncbi:acireductone dioxygenase [Telmatospirillum sp. J64-1]|uniref:1,2-dihydroxy-3-keto-5-methylthiopentene dioxygenase n=1 Tax=Telmatospirillum sp. J64-1 TaxID=2502183 RepID=UPI00115C64A9|nr:cupin domain-containing protein [Telmatospirillum sp. J64-1]